MKKRVEPYGHYSVGEGLLLEKSGLLEEKGLELVPDEEGTGFIATPRTVVRERIKRIKEQEKTTSNEYINSLKTYGVNKDSSYAGQNGTVLTTAQIERILEQRAEQLSELGRSLDDEDYER